MRIGRWITVVAIATVCVLLFLQAGIADAASSTTRHVTSGGAPPPHRAQAHGFGTASTEAAWRIVDTRSGTAVATSTG